MSVEYLHGAPARPYASSPNTVEIEISISYHV